MPRGGFVASVSLGGLLSIFRLMVMLTLLLYCIDSEIAQRVAKNVAWAYAGMSAGYEIHMRLSVREKIMMLNLN